MSIIIGYPSADAWHRVQKTLRKICFRNPNNAEKASRYVTTNPSICETDHDDYYLGHADTTIDSNGRYTDWYVGRGNKIYSRGELVELGIFAR